MKNKKSINFYSCVIVYADAKLCFFVYKMIVRV